MYDLNKMLNLIDIQAPQGLHRDSTRKALIEGFVNVMVERDYCSSETRKTLFQWHDIQANTKRYPAGPH